MFVYFWEREREKKRVPKWARGTEREREREREAGLIFTRTGAQAHPVWDSNSWDHDLSQSQMHPGALSVCLFLSERAWTGEGQRERERGRETEDPKQAWSWQQRAQCGVKRTNLKTMIWAKVRRSTDWAAQEPKIIWIAINAQYLL